MKNRAKLLQWILGIFLIPILMGSAWCGWQVYENSTQRAFIKDDLSEANSIQYGLFSVDRWREEIKNIIITQIDEFELSPSQDSILRAQISSLLYSVLDEARGKINRENGNFKDKLRKWAVNAMVDWDDLRQQVPAFTQIIVEDLTKPESKERLKILARNKLDEFATQTFDDTDSLLLNKIYHRYGEHNHAAFVETAIIKAEILQDKTYNYTYILLGVVLLFLALWILAYRFPELQTLLFIFSVVLAIIVLLTGVTSPMIEIDARIKKVDFVLLGQHIEFYDQMLFYRSKSILQVVTVMVESNKTDLLLVGILILIFSVILPVFKLVSTGIYLLAKKAKVRNNSLLKWLAFYSGKWSMADVIVVAIFMAYVGFDGVLDEQLKSVDMQSESLTAVSTNLSSLEPGFILFLTFVLFGLALATILKKITNTKITISSPAD